MHHLQSELRYTTQEISHFMLFEIDKENKFKTSILNNACCFKYSV